MNWGRSEDGGWNIWGIGGFLLTNCDLLFTILLLVFGFFELLRPEPRRYEGVRIILAIVLVFSGMVRKNWQIIDSELGSLKSHQQAILFQQIAIRLAKNRWPEMIATEVFRDGGEDALIPAAFTSNGRHLSVGCSITGTYAKICEDFRKLRKREVYPETFVFYTTEKIPAAAGKDNIESSEKWRAKFRKDFGCELIVITRENIIQELVDPTNLWMCREFLGLGIPYDLDVPAILESMSSASQEIIDVWMKNLLLSSFLVELTINEEAQERKQEISYEEITGKLSKQHRFVLCGPPGSGKTTTLIQLAQKLVEQEQIPILVSLPEWISSSNDNIIDYLVNKLCISERHITSENLVTLSQSGKLVFLLNGWNEVEASDIKRAAALLTRLNNDFIDVGIIIATRESSVKPPFFDESKLQIRELSRVQRRELIKHAIPDEWEDISSKIETDRSLSQVTRAPLFLSEVIKIYQDNKTLPRTRVEIFEQAIRRIEHSSEHAVYLQSPPMSERSEHYLTELSCHATCLGKVVVKNEDACREITRASTQLQAAGQLQTLPESTDILNVLCDHHILVRSSGPDVMIQFVHQQFQEYYAYLSIRQRLNDIVANEEKETIVRFQEESINYPVWEEPVRLLAEDVGDKIERSGDEGSLRLAECLIRWTIPVDPVFACELVNIVGATIWDAVKNELEPILRKWYECPDENLKKCALAAMFATGKDAFADIICPLLEHEDDQVRLTTYRTAKRFSVSSLGNNWKNRIDNWTEDRRSEFLSELSLNGEANVVGIFEDYAQNDPSTKVKVEAINAIGWYAPRNKLYEVISTCDDETFKIIINDGYIFDKLPDESFSKATKFYSQALKKLDDPRERLRLMLRMHKLCGSKVIKLLKKELEHFQPERGGSFVNNPLKIVASEDPEWVSLWVCQQVASGNLYYDYYSDYITKVPESLIGKLLQDFVKPDFSKQLEFETKKLIAVDATQEHIHFILQEIIRLSPKLKNPKTSISDPDRNLYHRLVDVARLLPLQNLSTVILQHYTKPDSVVLSVVLDLLRSFSQDVESDKSLNLEEETSHNLQQLLYNYLSLVLEEDDYSGRLKADISCVFALFGHPEDVAVINKLIYEDIARLRRSKEARKKGIKSGPQVNGGSHCCANWYVRALLRVNSDEVENLLIQLLNEPEYESDAANGLVQLLWKTLPAEKEGFGVHVPLAIGSGVWREKYIDPEKRKRFATAIAARISCHIKERQEQDNWRVPKELARNLAMLNDPDTIPLILEILAIPGRFDAWNRMRTLEILIRNGNCLETITAEDILNPAIEQATDIRISGKQDMYLLAQCLCILSCTDDMQRAVNFIDQILAKHTLLYELRGLIETLGNRSHSEAARYLVALCQQERLYNALCYELIQALSKTNAPEAKQALLSTVDDSIMSPRIPMPNRQKTNSLIHALGDIFESDEVAQKRLLLLCHEENLSEAQKTTLLSVVTNSASNEGIKAAISMLSQYDDKCSMPYELKDAVERALVQNVPINNAAYAYDVRPKANSELRRYLFETVIKKEGKWMLALKVVGYMEWVRLKYGRPQLEPRHCDFRSGILWLGISDDGMS